MRLLCCASESHSRLVPGTGLEPVQPNGQGIFLLLSLLHKPSREML